MNKPLKKILIFALCGMGDLIMLTPAIASFKKNYPDSKITVVIRKYMPKEILENNPYTDKISNYPDDFIINVWTGWFKSKQKLKDIHNLIKEIKFLLKLRQKKYDLSLWAFPGEAKRGAIVSFLSGAKISMGPKYRIFGFKTGLFYNIPIEFNPKNHAVEGNLEYLRKLGINKLDKKIHLKLSEEGKNFAEEFLRKNKVKKGRRLVGIHPGCDKANIERRWPVENFVELVKRLIKNNNKVIIFEGPDEENILGNFENLDILNGRNLSFKQLAALINKCDVMLTSDSGLGHIAAALNIPTVTLFGPANPCQTKPYGNKGIVISKLDPSYYFEEDKQKLLKIEGRKALEKITVEEVSKGINKILNN